MADSGKILVFVDLPDGELDETGRGLLSYGARLAGFLDLDWGAVTATITEGETLAGFGAYGAPAITRMVGGERLLDSPALLGRSLARLTADCSATLLMLPHNDLGANLAPIVVARINTERSFFQTKDSVQQMVLGVVQAYWALVSARTEVLARRSQVTQGEWAYDWTQARMATGNSDAAEVAQALSSLEGFRATLIVAEGSLLQREAALRSMLQLPPEDGTRIVPVTPPIFDVVDPNWQELLRMAETHRPDLIETKLVLEADHQQLLMAKNRALPQLDAVGVYRWNGLEGRTPDQRLISDTGRLGEWQIGVNFSVPLGLRSARAGAAAAPRATTSPATTTSPSTGGKR